MLVCNLFGIDLANLIKKAKKSGQDSGDEDWRIHTMCLDMGQLSKLQRRLIGQKHQILPLLWSGKVWWMGFRMQRGIKRQRRIKGGWFLCRITSPDSSSWSFGMSLQFHDNNVGEAVTWGWMEGHKCTGHLQSPGWRMLRLWVHFLRELTRGENK
jgi:hypothetical protein